MAFTRSSAFFGRGFSSLLADSRCLDVVAAAGGCLVGVSGGADSIALLHVLFSWGAELAPPLRLEVVHVNHQLRGEAAEKDAEFVRALCCKLGVPFHLRQTESPSSRPRGTTVEEFLRGERHRCFLRVLEENGIAALAIGHTSDDLAETFLMHLMRGAGLHGLAFRAVEEFGKGKLVRPLWRRSRPDILRYLLQHGLAHREDASNLSLEFTRNRVRHVLLPAMEREFNPSVREALLRSAAVLSLAEEHVRRTVEEHLADLVSESGAAVELPLGSFRDLDRFLQMEIAGAWIRAATGEAVRPGFEQIEQVLAIGASGRGCVQLAAGAVVTVAEDRLILFLPELPGATSPSLDGGLDTADKVAGQLARRYLEIHPDLPLADLPEGREFPGRSADAETDSGEIALLDGSFWRLVVSFRNGAVVAGGRRGIEIRNRRPGDRISESVKLKEVLIGDRVPWFVRDYLIVVADRAGRVLHVIGLERINARIAERLGGAPVAVSCEQLKSPPR